MKRGVLMPIPVEPDLKGMIKDAAAKTHLSQAAVMRSALRLGIPELVKRLDGVRQPRRNFAQYIGLFSGIPRSRERVKPSRFR